MRTSTDFAIVIQKLLKNDMELKLFITEQGTDYTREYRITEVNLDFGMQTIDGFSADDPDELIMLCVNEFAEDCTITTDMITCTYCSEDNGMKYDVVVRPYGFDYGFIAALAN